MIYKDIFNTETQRTQRFTEGGRGKFLDPTFPPQAIVYKERFFLEKGREAKRVKREHIAYWLKVAYVFARRGIYQ